MWNLTLRRTRRCSLGLKGMFIMWTHIISIDVSEFISRNWGTWSPTCMLLGCLVMYLFVRFQLKAVCNLLISNVVVIFVVTSFIQQHASSQESLCDHVASILQPIVVPKQNKKILYQHQTLRKLLHSFFF